MLPQPSDCERTRPNTSPNSPVDTSTSPGRSKCLTGPRLSTSRAPASGMSASPMGTLTQKIRCHEAACVRNPPTSGPAATPMPLIADHTPSASPRRSGGNASASSVRVSGVTSAAPTPWSGTGADQEVDRGGKSRGGGTDGEHGDADHEHPLASQAVAERRAGQQQHRVGEDVCVHRPLERLDRGSQVAVDARQGDVHDEVVEHGHEQPERDDHEGPDPAALGDRCLHGAPFSLLSEC